MSSKYISIISLREQDHTESLYCGKYIIFFPDCPYMAWLTCAIDYNVIIKRIHFLKEIQMRWLQNVKGGQDLKRVKKKLYNNIQEYNILYTTMST